MTRVLAFACALGLCLASPSLATPVAQVGAYRFPVLVGGNALSVPYEGNQLLTESHSQVTRAVVIVPGSLRDSDNGYSTLTRSASLAGVNNSTSLLIVPQFLIEEDIEYHDLPADWLYWSDSGWKQGDPSLSTSSHPRPGTISSFSVLDSILFAIALRNPNLKSIVVAGHSAGGQFVQRFAAGSTTPQTLESQFGVQVAYVAANPSSYLYLNAERVASGTSTFRVPNSGSCSSYDRYKYGLQSRNAYMSAVSSTQIVAQYRPRRVTYLLGALDNDPGHPDLDTSCAANLQGSHRLERGLIFGDYLAHFYGAASATTHETVVVPGVGHDSRDMLTSPAGVSRLFPTFDDEIRPAAVGDLRPQ
jgi:hypothetical protein